jgi:hypothetical protein
MIRSYETCLSAVPLDIKDALAKFGREARPVFIELPTNEPQLRQQTIAQVYPVCRQVASSGRIGGKAEAAIRKPQNLTEFDFISVVGSTVHRK